MLINFSAQTSHGEHYVLNNAKMGNKFLPIFNLKYAEFFFDDWTKLCWDLRHVIRCIVGQDELDNIMVNDHHVEIHICFTLNGKFNPNIIDTNKENPWY